MKRKKYRLESLEIEELLVNKDDMVKTGREVKKISTRENILGLKCFQNNE